MPNARKAALLALLKVDGEQGYSNLALDGVLRDAGLSDRDAAFASALFYGVLERRMTLDFILRRRISRGFARLSPLVREALRLGAYQLVYLDKIPPSAAVNESVRLVRESRESRSAGFVNAVLRGFSREGAPPLPQDGSAESLSVAYSCAAWLCESLRTDYGEEAARGILAAGLEPAATFARVNPLRADRETLTAALKAEKIPCAPADGLELAVRLTPRGGVQELEAYRAGLFHVQDPSSQLCAEALDPRPGMRVLDLCAAPGGKSFTAAERMENRGEVVACDLHAHRVGLIEQGARRLGLSCIRARTGDAAEYDGALGGFDRVLCDVPCSGFGVMRRKPEVKYKSEEQTAELPALQAKILENAARYVDPGGRLLYSTCTLRSAENEKIAERFLAHHPEFAPVECALPPAFEKGALRRGHTVTLLPHKIETDGFFFAAFERK